MYVNLYIVCMNKYNFVKVFIVLNLNVNNCQGYWINLKKIYIINMIFCV